MRIERVIFRDLRALEARDDVLLDLDDRPHGAVCIRGLNGSGKSTWLEAVAQLWQWFRRCLKQGAWASPSRDLPDPLLPEARLVAVKVSGLPGPCPSLWLAYGTEGEVAVLLAQEHAPGVQIVDGRPRWDAALLEWWSAEAERAEHGRATSPVPNLVHIGAETKFVPKATQKDLFSTDARPAMLWVHRYDPRSRFNVPLEAQIGTLRLVDPQRYERLESEVARLLAPLSLHGFDAETRRPVFRRADRDLLLPVERLSAGERSVLVNLVTVLQGLQPGGVVLLDEPELHLHVSLMRSSLSALERLVTGMGGQLIVASHATEVWDMFRPRGALVDLSPGPQR